MSVLHGQRQLPLGEKEDLPGKFEDTGWAPPGFPIRNPEWARELLLRCHFDAEVSAKKSQVDLWQLGDVLVWIEDHYGEDDLYQWAPDTGFTKRTYSNLMRICRAFSDHSRRWPPHQVSVWTHGEVAAEEMSHERADEHLRKLAQQEYSGRSEMRDEIAKERDEDQQKKDQAAIEAAGADLWPHCPVCEGGSCPHCGQTCGTCRGAGKLSPDHLAGLQKEALAG